MRGAGGPQVVQALSRGPLRAGRGHHVGRVAEPGDSDLILSQLPGEGFRATIDGYNVSVTDAHRLARVFDRLTAAMVSMAAAAGA